MSGDPISDGPSKPEAPQQGLPLDGDLVGADLTGADLTGADLTGVDLSEANLQGARLAGATLYRTGLRNAELLGADLREAQLEECDAAGAGLGGVDLRGASLRGAGLENATLSHARLAGADLRFANLEGTRLEECDLSGADLTNAVLRGCRLLRARVPEATFDGCDLRGSRMSEIADFERASWIGVDLRDVDFRGGLQLRRFILDENYLHEFRSRSRRNLWVYRIWRATSDCGRSFGRWALWVLLVVVAFAGAYELADLDYGDHPTPLSPLYFSIVTLTTLGYGDVVPASTAAQGLAVLEVCVGYLALGGLISIFANKMARRAE